MRLFAFKCVSVCKYVGLLVGGLTIYNLDKVTYRAALGSYFTLKVLRICPELLIIHKYSFSAGSVFTHRVGHSEPIKLILYNHINLS